MFLAAISDGPYAFPNLTLPFRQRGAQEKPNLRAKNFIFANPGEDSPKLAKFSKLLRHAINLSVLRVAIGAPQSRGSLYAHESPFET
jgi:hypothetical protein